MKLSFSTLACPTWTLDQIIDAAADNGIEGVDFRGLGQQIDITKLPEFNEQLDQTLGRFRDRGIELPCYNTSVTLVSPSPQRWQEMLEECQRYAQLAGRTGTATLRVFGGKVPAGMTRDEAASMARRHLRQVSKICQAHGCIPVLETHDDWATAPSVLELLHEMTPDEAGVLWDTEHTYRSGESPNDTAQALARYIRHTHFKDSVRGEKRNEPRLLGEGDLPIRDFVTALKSAGYDGWLSLESEKRWHADAPDPAVAIPQFAKYMRGILEAR